MHKYNSDLSEEGTEYLTIRNDPIVIADPAEYDFPARSVSPKPYLRRGSGLQRYHMSVDYFRKGPPDLYKKDSFKSFLHNGPAKKPPVKVQNVIKTCRPCPKAKTLTKASTLVSNSQQLRSFPKRECAINTIKCFDDEVIPSLRDRTNAAFEVAFDPIESLCRSNVLKIPKTPVKNLLLKQCDMTDDLPFDRRKGNNLEADESSSSDESTENDPAARRSIVQDIFSKNAIDNQLTDRLLDRPRFNPEHEDGSNLNSLQKDDCCEELLTDCDVKCAENERRNERQIALAVKRKGLTDNVKKHLNWNVTPRKKRIAKIIKIKKPKPVVKKEKYTIHEFKHRLTLMLEENKKLQADNHRMMLNEKTVQDEKVKVSKLKKENENMLKIEKELLDEERQKLVEEQKKLKREKVAFDKYCQETRNLPSREDRELIRNLKEEILKLKEEQKTKEIRVGAAQAQLRNRVVFLEKENKELRKDLEMAQRVTSKKIVRFETVSNFRNKVINAINDHLDKNIDTTRPHSAGERPTSVAKPLRRSKSAVDLKVATKASSAKHRRGISVNAISLEPKSNAVVNGDTIYTKTLKDDTDTPSVPEVIDLVGENRSANEVLMKDNDSGIGSKYSSENSPTRSCTLVESGDSELFLKNSQKENTYFSKNNCCPLIDSKTKGRGYSSDCHGCMPSQWNKENIDHNRHLLEWEKYTPSLNITTESSITPPRDRYPATKVNAGSKKCGRHGCPVVEDATKKWSSCLVDRDVVRTQLASGDVEEEELHTGVRRVLCSLCAAVEISYRNRPGYRRTHLPQEEVLEEHPDGVVELRRKNGEVLRKYPNGDRLLILVNGDKELTTRGYKKLETANGTVKIVFDSGRTETRYRSGRVRIKDEHGHLIMDTGGLPH